MIFDLEFDSRALKEWHELDKSVREQLKKKLPKLQQTPYIASARLHGDLAGFFKIKLKKSGVRLIYQPLDDKMTLFIIAVGKRADDKAWHLASQRK